MARKSQTASDLDGSTELWGSPSRDGQRVPSEALEPTQDADERRWRAQTVVAPIEQLVRSLAHAQIGDDDYDVRRLSHRAIDLAVRSMGFAQETTDDEVVEDLAAMARAMRPDAAPDAWRDVAGKVFRGLLNEQHEYDKFRFVGIGGDSIRRPFSFRILELREAGTGYAVEASSEAINVYLSALAEVDPSDADFAFQTLLSRQLEDGRLEQAAATAAIAGRASIASAALITDAIESAKREVDSERWAAEVEPELARAASRVRARIAEDDRLVEKVRDLTEHEELEVRHAAGRVGDIVREARQVHLALERRLVAARPLFLEALRHQKLARRPRLRLLSLDAGLFRPTLALPRPAALEVTDRFAEEALGFIVPRIMRLDHMIDTFLMPMAAREARPIEAEPINDGDQAPDPQRFSPESMRSAGGVLATSRVVPRRLSSMLSEARDAAEPDVTVLVRLASLFAFAPERSDDADEEETRPGDLVDDLSALDDGARLDDLEYAGADLLVGSSSAIADVVAANQEDCTVPEGPIPINRARLRR